MSSRALDASRRRAALLQVREFQDSRRVQGARRGQCGVLAGRRRARRAVVGHPFVGQSRRGARVGGRAPRHPRLDRHAGQAPAIKQANVRGFGGQVRLCAPNVAAREAACAAVQAETGATLVHPYNDWRVIAGQGTAALELLDDVPDLDAVIAPVGGGGLLSGTAIAAEARARRSACTAPSRKAPTMRSGRWRRGGSSRRTIRGRSPTACSRRSASGPLR